MRNARDHRQVKSWVMSLIKASKRTVLLRRMAEREGFEPSRRLPAYTRSRRAPSTTRPPLPEIERFRKAAHYSEAPTPFKRAREDRRNVTKAPFERDAAMAYVSGKSRLATYRSCS